MPKSRPADLAGLRRHIEKLEGARNAVGVLPFGIEAIDRRLAGGGLTLGALHEVAGVGNGAIDGAAPALFAAGIAARTAGQVLWCTAKSDLFAPGLAQAGLAAKRLILVDAPDDDAVLAACEEGLRHGGLGAVVGETAKLSMIASRRLQLAAEGKPALSIVLRRWRRERDAAAFGVPTAAVTRWRITPAASAALPVDGIGRPRWYIELLRSKGGTTAEFLVEACDDKGCLALAAVLADRSAQTAPERIRAAS